MTNFNFSNSILICIIFLGVTVFSNAQIGYVGDAESNGDIFDVEAEGSQPRTEDGCYNIYNDDRTPLRIDLSIFTGAYFDGNSLPCNLGVNVTIGTEIFERQLYAYGEKEIQDDGTVVTNTKLKGSIEITEYHINNSLSECIDGVQFLPIKIEITCSNNGETEILTLNEINKLIDRNFIIASNAGPNGEFYHIINIPFCCPNSSIDNLAIENRSSISDNNFIVINHPSQFELQFDGNPNDKDLKVGLFDFTGRNLIANNNSFQKIKNSIFVPKPLSQNGLFLISVRTKAQIITKKVLIF